MNEQDIIREHYAKIGKKGAESVLKKYGKNHFSELAKKKAAKYKKAVDNQEKTTE